MGNKPSGPQQIDSITLSKFSHFNEQNVTHWFNQFNALYSNKYITQKDLELSLNQLFPHGHTHKFACLLYNKINLLNNGQLDLNELLIAFSILAKGSKYEKLRWLFRFCDIDNDGVVSRLDVRTVLYAIIDLLGKFLDINCIPSDLVDEMFECVHNMSGFLTFDDFITLADRRPEILERLTMFSKYL